MDTLNRSSIEGYRTLWPITLLVAAAALGGCMPRANALVGVWQFDGDRTERALAQDAAAPAALLTCYHQKICGSAVLTFSEHRWHSSQAGEVSDANEGIPYRVISRDSERIVIENIDEQHTRAEFRFISANEAYVDVDWNGYRWRDYFRRVE